MTNLYSAAVFIGWGAVVLGIVLELVYRVGIGTTVAAVAGFATLLIAYLLSASGDTFSVLWPCSTRSSGWPLTSPA